MEILSSKLKNTYALTIRKEWIPEVTFSTNYEIDILNKFSGLPDANIRLLEILQFFNANIFKVDAESWKYCLNFEGKVLTLPFFRFSRGEKFLALVLMADMTKSNVYLCYELGSLSVRSLYYFLDNFKSSKFIHVVPPSAMLENMLRDLL